MTEIPNNTSRNDVRIMILAKDGESWNTLNRLATENRKLDSVSGVAYEEKRQKLIEYAESMKDGWINNVFDDRRLKVVK